MVKTNLVLLSYGKETEYYRAIFCVLSFIAWNPVPASNVRILIYTDNPDIFEIHLKGADIEYIRLTPFLLDEMLGDTGFFHRRKIAVIDMTFKKFPEDNLLFVDSDTFFIAEPMALINGFEKGKSFMHKCEYSLKEGLRLFTSFNQAEYPIAFLEHISDKKFLIGDRYEQFDENDYSWNAGVLGFTKHFSTYIGDVFRLCDEFYANSKWFISEQMAFALILQRTTKIHASDQYIIHYWGQRQKALLDGLIINLFHERSLYQLKSKSFIMSLTKKWTKKIKNDLIEEQIEIAYDQKNLYYGMKKSVLLILDNPFNPRIYKFVLNALKF